MPRVWAALAAPVRRASVSSGHMAATAAAPGAVDLSRSRTKLRLPSSHKAIRATPSLPRASAAAVEVVVEAALSFGALEDKALPVGTAAASP